MVLRSALAHRLQNHVWIRGSASNHYLQIPARLRLQFSSVARSTSFYVLFAALSLTEVADRDTELVAYARVARQHVASREDERRYNCNRELTNLASGPMNRSPELRQNPGCEPPV